MPITTTLRGVPDSVYERLKVLAAANRRSINSEIIACLESVLMPTKATASEHISAARAVRARLPRDHYNHDEIQRRKQRGRS